MPDINMQHFEELQRNQHSIDVEIDASQIASPQQDFPMMLETPNSSNSVLNVIAINELGEQLPTEIEGIANYKNWIHFKDIVHSGWNRKMKVFYGGCIGKPAADSTYGSQAVWNNEATYHMNQDPNGDIANSIKDSTPNANHGTPVGSMTSADLIDGEYGKAIDFDGSNDLIDIGNIDFGISDFAIITKVKFNSYEDGAGIIKKNSGSGNPQWYVRQLGVSGAMQFVTYDGSTVREHITGNSYFSTGNYYSFAAKRDSTTLYLYKDGAEVSTAGNAIDTTNAVNVNVGVAATTYALITIDELRLFRSAPTANYISTTHKNLNNPTAMGIDSFYKSISKELNFSESLQSLGRAG